MKKDRANKSWLVFVCTVNRHESLPDLSASAFASNKSFNCSISGVNFKSQKKKLLWVDQWYWQCANPDKQVFKNLNQGLPNSLACWLARQLATADTLFGCIQYLIQKLQVIQLPGRYTLRVCVNVAWRPDLTSLSRLSRNSCLVLPSCMAAWQLVLSWDCVDFSWALAVKTVFRIDLYCFYATSVRSADLLKLFKYYKMTVSCQFIRRG